MFLPLLLACSGATPADDTAAETGAPDTCAGSLPRGQAEAVATGFEDGTEGIAFMDNQLFVSVPDGVVAISPDGTTTRLATLDHALGLAPAIDALLVADPGAFTFDGSGDDGSVVRVGVDGTATTLATGVPNSNFVATLPTGAVLVADDTAAIYRVDSGTPEVWTDAVPSPNGMAVSPDGDTLWVVSTFVEDPPLWRVPLSGSDPGTPESFATFATGSAPDGLAVDAEGGVWVAANVDGDVDRVDPETGEIERVARGLTNPASLAFGTGGDWDPCSVYVTELYGDTVWRVGAGVEGLGLRVP